MKQHSAPEPALVLRADALCRKLSAGTSLTDDEMRELDALTRAGIVSEQWVSATGTRSGVKILELEAIRRFRTLTRKLADGKELKKTERAELDELIANGATTEDNIRIAVSTFQEFDTRLKDCAEARRRVELARAAAVNAAPGSAAERQAVWDEMMAGRGAAQSVNECQDFANEWPELFPSVNVKALVEKVLSETAVKI